MLYIVCYTLLCYLMAELTYMVEIGWVQGPLDLKFSYWSKRLLTGSRSPGFFFGFFISFISLHGEENISNKYYL
jgi:hypothetical protein